MPQPFDSSQPEPIPPLDRRVAMGWTIWITLVAVGFLTQFAAKFRTFLDR